MHARIAGLAASRPPTRRHEVRMSVRSISRFLCLLFVTATTARAQTGAIAGRVTDSTTTAPLSGATITALSGMSAAGSATSGEDGSFRIVNLAAGTYVLSVRQLGYSERRVAGVRVEAGGTAQLDVRLSTTSTQLNPVVVTGGRQPEKILESPNSIAVVETREIAQRPSVTAADHLKGVPGVDVNAGGIAQANVVARGFNNAFSGALLTLQDYRFAAVPSLRVNVPFLFTGTNEDIERMEILLGPASALYGPNSANGVLHIITKSPFTSQGTSLTLDGGERSLVRGAVRHAGLIGEKAGYKLSGEYFTGTDWKYQDPGEPGVYPAQAPASRRGQDVERDFNIERYAGEARLDLRPRGPNGNMEAITTYGFTKALGGIDLTAANGTGQIKNWTYQSIQQRFRWDRLFAQVFLNFSDAGNSDSLATDGTFLLRSGQPIVDQSRVFSAQIQHATDLGAKHTFVYGLDYIFTNPRTGNTINGRNEDVDDITEVGGYVQYTGRLTNKFDVVGALRADRNDQVEGTQISPRAALIFKPTESQNFRVTYNRAFNTPQNFSFFLDLINSRNIGGSGFDIRAQGNPPKEGWQFSRGCSAASFGGICMKSRLAGNGAFVDASAASTFRGFFTAQRTAFQTAITGALQAGGLPAPQAQALGAAVANALSNLNPTSANVGTVVRYLDRPTVALQPGDVRDIAELKASFNNSYEFGYKGILGNRARLAVDLWYQQRGDVGAPASIATPNIFFDPQTLGTYLGANIAQTLISNGVPQAQAAAIAGQLAPALTQSAARAPLGVITFDSPLASSTDVIATYQTINEEVDIQGLDIGFDFILSPRWNMAATYSWVSDVIFEDVRDAQGNALALNAPDNKGSLTLRWNDEIRGLSAETRGRYANTFPVNSGVYASTRSFPAPATLNQNVPDGTYTTAPGSTSQCSELAPTACVYTYPPVPVNMFVDLGFSWRLPIRGSQQIMWSINGTNIFDNKRPTFAGVPQIGRMVMTRIQYAF
jgi:outer membrane receptor for ferrienterochelin and colicins